MNSTAEILYSKLVKRKMYFRPFKWDFLIENDNALIQNISNNKYFKIHYEKYKKICQLYPSMSDINDYVNGCFINGDINIYDLKYEDISEKIHKWDKAKRSYLEYIETEIEEVKNYLKENDLVKSDLYKGSIPLIFSLYHSKKISKLTLAVIYCLNEKEFDLIKKSTKLKDKSIQKNLFYLELYKGYKLFKLLQFSQKSNT